MADFHQLEILCFPAVDVGHFFKVPGYFSYRMGIGLKLQYAGPFQSQIEALVHTSSKIYLSCNCIFLIIVSGHVYCFFRFMNDCSLKDFAFNCSFVPCTTVPCSVFFHIRLPPYDALSPLMIIFYFFVRYFDVYSAFFVLPVSTCLVSQTFTRRRLIGCWD